MPKAPAFVPKPALEKLPLAVRKDSAFISLFILPNAQSNLVRDNYEGDKEDFETTISEKLGVPFKININPNEVWAYATDSSSSAGGLLKRYALLLIILPTPLMPYSYAEGFVDGLTRYLEKYGDDGKEQYVLSGSTEMHMSLPFSSFNQAVTQSELSVNVNPLGEAAPTISCDVKDGVFRILFRASQLGYNQSYVYDYILPAIEGVAREGFSLKAKNSIEQYWKSEEEDLQKEIGEILALPDVVLDPNFEEVYQALVAGKKDSDWQDQFGRAIHAYFSDGLKYQLERQGFKGDDMLQEGAAEILSSKTFRLRIVPKLVKGSYHEVVIEDGVAYLQTTADKWYYNTSEMGQGFIDLL